MGNVIFLWLRVEGVLELVFFKYVAHWLALLPNDSIGLEKEFVVM